MASTDSNGNDSNGNDPIQPAAISPAPITPTNVPLTNAPDKKEGNLPEETIPWQQRPTTYVALAVSILLALIVVFVLPSLVKPPETTPVVINPEAISTQAVQEAPFRDAQLAKARRESQDSLSKLLEKQSFLEKRNVQLWDKSTFELALKHATEGDFLYRQRNFPEAQTAYQNALSQLSALEQRIPEELSSNLKKGDDAFAQGQPEQAKQFYELALAIDASSVEAKTGLERTASLDQVLALIAQGNASLEQTTSNRLEDAKGNLLKDAQGYFQKALELDPVHPEAIKGKETASNLILSRDFNAAMSRGYQSLEANQFSNAAKAFREALKLKPGDQAANTGLSQANNSSAQYTRSSRLNQATAFEKKEKWHEALNIYNKILAKDSSVVTAKLGQIRSSTRAGLSDAIEKILASPLRLNSPNVFKHSQQVLKDAEGIQSPGPRHQQQVTQLRQVLTAAMKPVNIELQSDNNTLVTLFRVGELGTFNQKQITLKPGNYVAVGNRNGYRDVRVEFQVTQQGLSSPVVVVCKEPV
jgi:hypothetical protein